VDIIDTLNIAASGLSAQRLRLQTISSNMANAKTTRTDEGGPYARKVPVFEAREVDPFGGELDRALSRVEVSEVRSAGGEGQRVYDPEHPDADAEGFVTYPDVDILREMVDMMTVTRAYEANANVIDTTRDMARRALEIGR